MKNILSTLGFLILIVVTVLYAYSQDNTTYSQLLYTLAVGFFGLAAYLGYFENIRSALWMLAFAGGTYWSGSKTIETIDFSKPFLLSFYWSTVGYFFLSLILLFLTIVYVLEVAKEPDRI